MCVAGVTVRGVAECEEGVMEGRSGGRGWKYREGGNRGVGGGEDKRKGKGTYSR